MRLYEWLIFILLTRRLQLRVSAVSLPFPDQIGLEVEKGR
jgi:hypothetical protein